VLTALSVNNVSTRKLNEAITAGKAAVAIASEQDRHVNWSEERVVLRLHRHLPTKTKSRHSVSDLYKLPLHGNMSGPLELTEEGGWCCTVCQQSGNAAWPWKRVKLSEHLGSISHLKALEAQQLSGSLRATAKAAGQAMFDAGQIIEVAKDTVAILAAHGTMSFNNAATCLRAAQQLVTDITRGYSITATDLRTVVGNPQLHGMLLRLRAVSCRPNVSPPLTLRYTNISRRIHKLAGEVLPMKREFFQQSRSVWMIIDETTTRPTLRYPVLQRILTTCYRSLDKRTPATLVGQS